MTFVKSHWRWLAIIFLVLGNWIYGVKVERASHLAQSAAKGIIFTSIYSDLYPRWLGARELLLHGRDPYSHEITADIHEGWTGQQTAPGDPVPLTDAFAYPLYVVFMLAPLTPFPYELLMPWIYTAMLLLVALTVWWWQRMLGAKPGSSTIVLILLGCGSLSAVGAITQQQPVVMVMACLAGAAACIRRGADSPSYERWHLLAGGLLALATIKPQCCVLLLPVLGVWVLGDLRDRRGLFIGFAGTLGVLLLASELLFPGWILVWLGALREYQQVISVATLLEIALPATLVPFAMAAGGLALGFIAWRMRHASPKQLGFQILFALPLLASYLVFPSWNYQQLLLYPAALVVLGQRQEFVSRGQMGRAWYAVIVNLLLLPFLVEAIGAIIWGIAVIQQHPEPYLPAMTLHHAVFLPLLIIPFVLLFSLGWLSWHSIRSSSKLRLPTMTTAPEPRPS